MKKIEKLTNLENEQQKNDSSTSLEERFYAIKQTGKLSNQSIFTTQVLNTLSQTSKSLKQIIEDEMSKRGAQTLLTHVVLGEQKEAEEMIKANPKLLNIKASATDYSDRIITGTPFQAALGAGDEPMWEMMWQYLDKEEALKQFDEQFPNGTDEQESVEVLKPIYENLEKKIAGNDDQGQSAIEEFRKEITARKEITQGKHFNLNELVAAYQVYIKNYYTPNRNKFHQQVIGYLQGQMTAYDAQVHFSEVESVLTSKANFSRSHSFGDIEEFFPLSGKSGPGVGCARSLRPGALRHVELLEKFIEQKQASLQDLRSRLVEACVTNCTNSA